MSKEIVEEPFREAAGEVERAHQEAVEEMRAKVSKVKSETLKKIKA